MSGIVEYLVSSSVRYQPARHRKNALDFYIIVLHIELAKPQHPAQATGAGLNRACESRIRACRQADENGVIKMGVD
jgi:hypothetical protein